MIEVLKSKQDILAHIIMSQGHLIQDYIYVVTVTGSLCCVVLVVLKN